MSISRSKGLAALGACVPDAVRRVCARLDDAGHRAFTVGGAVRDALLGRTPGDWDVTTSAMPDEVMALFKKTIPTGLEHGTVTVMAGTGDRRMAIEVTTFRGDGTYSDARRPDEVIFGVSLEEDLARRDFVINALAYDPISGVLEDPFNGFADIEAGVIRAVGDPQARFTEDGLRVMRAVRFVSVLEFELAPETEAAMTPSLPSLARVARERIRVELLKLLAGPGALRALDISHRHLVLETAIPLIAVVEWDRARERIAKVDGDAVLRLAAMFSDAEGPAIDAIETGLRTLTLSNDERGRILTCLRHLHPAGSIDDAGLRAHLGDARRVAAADLIALWRAVGSPLADRAQSIIDAGDALTIGELAVRGKDVMDVLGIGPGRRIGEILATLLAVVHRDPTTNTRDQLIAMIKAQA